MARKNSLGCGTAIIGLIALAMTAKYWYVLVVIGFVALTIWGVIKVLKSWSIETGNDASTPIERDFDNGNIMVTDSFSGLSRSIKTGNTDTLIAKHFVDNGDGTVTDSHTGLSWMRCAMGQTWDGIACNGGGTLCTWKQAKALSLPYSFAGRNDWRLPTCDELKSIVEPHQKEPAINTDIFSQTACLDFWSSSPYDKDSIHAWIVDFSVGVAYLSNRIIGRSVRLVRGGQDIEKAAASEVGTAKKAADVAVAANPITDTPAPIVISATEAHTLINHRTPQNNPDLLKEILDRNNTNMKVDHVNAVIGKDPASEKAAAEVAMKIINRLGTALVDTEIQRTLDAKKAALLERVAQVDAEIEKVLAAEKKVQIIKRLLAVLECISTQRILEAENAASQERVALVDSEIGRDLSTENVTTTPTEIHKIDKPIEKRIGHFIDNGDGTVTDSRRPDTILDHSEAKQILDSEKAATRERVDQVNAEIERILATEKAATSSAGSVEKSAAEVALKQKTTEDLDLIDNVCDVLASVETQWILDSENMGMQEHIVQEDAEIERVAPQEQNARCAFCNAWGLHDILSVTGHTIDCHCFACGKNFFISKVDTDLITPTPIITLSAPVPTLATSFDTIGKEVAEDKKLYNFIPTHELEMLKADDQWFEETTYFMLRIHRGAFRFLEPDDQWFTDPTLKRGLREGAAKPFEWILPFMSYEVVQLKELKEIVRWGPNSVSQIAKPLRALIRERKKSKEPYSILLYALYCSCVLTDFVKSLSFEGTPINIMARYVDVRELRNTHIDYSAIGYNSIDALSKTDVKWLVDAFGKPAAHKTFNALWPNIRQNAISRYCWEEFRRENKSTRYWQMPMNAWLPKLVNRNNELARSTVWMEQKFVRRVQFAGRPEIVQTAESAKLKGYRSPTLSPPKPPHIFSLDMSSIKAKLAETAAVSALLKGVFTEDAPVPPQTAVLKSTATEASIADLDAESLTFMLALSSKRIWSRNELEKLAADHNLMLDGTLDSINDASFDHFGGPFFEGDDPIEIDPDIVGRLASRDSCSSSSI